MANPSYGSLPFNAQIAFFRKKLALPTQGWTDIWQANHDHAFVVAGANKMALVEDFQAAVQKAIEQGTTIHEFRKDFDAIVQKHGWSYKGGRGWRTRVIYDTNIRMSHAAGRYTQLQRLPFWQYHHAHAVANPREQHVAWDGLVLAKDDPFWSTHYPPNGWGCRCSVTGMSEARMKRKNLSLSDSPVIAMKQVTVGKNSPNPRTVDVPEGISPGFAYAPGRSAWIKAHVPMPEGKPPHGFDKLIPAASASDLLPDPRPFPKSKLLPAMQAGQEEAYAQKFLQVFGADIGKPVVFTDAMGEAVIISENLFKDYKGRWKMGKGSRSSEIMMLAEAIRNPDEIWVSMMWHNLQGKAVSSRVYISRYTLAGKAYVAVVVWNYMKGWHGVTAYASKSASEFNARIGKNRKGIRIFKRL